MLIGTSDPQHFTQRSVALTLVESQGHHDLSLSCTLLRQFDVEAIQVGQPDATLELAYIRTLMNQSCLDMV